MSGRSALDAVSFQVEAGASLGVELAVHRVGPAGADLVDRHEN